MEKALKILPMNPTGTYEEVIGRIKASGAHTFATARSTLSWLFYAPRPLRFDELCDIIHFEEKQDCAEYDPVETTLTTADLIRICQSLIVYDEAGRSIRFVHFTVQDYLKSWNELLRPADIAWFCLNYLMSGPFDTVCPNDIALNARFKTHCFFSYASNYWGFHIRGDLELSPGIYQAVLELLEPEDRRQSINQVNRLWSADDYHLYDHRSWYFRSVGMTTLHVLAKNGLPIICQKVLCSEL
jgi:hypothetical protein